MIMSKALGGLGFPISGLAFKEKLNTLPRGLHIGTFRGNVLAFAAGAAAIRFMVENDLAGHARSIGGILLEGLRDLEARSRIVGEVRGLGLMLGVELVKDKDGKEPSPELAAAVRQACHRRGLLIEVGGHYFNVARFLPPLVLTRELAEKGLGIFAEAIREVEKAT
jgi:diaminobutyrate-2-oxoglutarate transaminase